MSQTAIPREPFLATTARHAGELIRLAIPVIFARAGMLTMMIVDAIMVGRYAAEELAFQAIGLAPMMFIMVTAIGLLIGTLVRTAHNVGAGTPENCGAVWHRSLGYAFLIGMTGLIASLYGEEFLLLTGQSAELSRGGGEVIRIIGYSTPVMLLYITSAFFLEGLKRPKPGMFIMIGANLLNVLLNWMLIYGNLGFDAMGAAGSAWATLAVRVVSVPVILTYIWRLADGETYGVRQFKRQPWSSWVHQRRIGYSAGASNGIESAAFSSMNFFAGLLGTIPLAAFSISFNMLALIFMIALGIGTATAVCVGNAHGRRDTRDMAFAGWTGLGLSTITMILAGILLVTFSEDIAGIYSTDPELIAAAAPLIVLVAFILVADAGQSVMAHALRGRSETWVPAAMHTVSYLIIMMPGAWLLSHTYGRGAIGIQEAVLIASIVSVCLLTLRFWWLCRRDLRAANTLPLRTG